MNVLQLASACAYEIGVSAPVTLVGSTDPATLQVLNLIYAVSRDLRQARCWEQLKRKYAFVTVASQQSYQLPKDYFSPLPGTYWDADKSLRMIGPYSDSGFTDKTKGNLGSSFTEYRIFGPDFNPYSAGGQFEIWPIPSSIQNLYFEYLTKSFFMPKHWAPSTVYASGAYVNANGNIYKCDTNGTSDASTAPTGQTQNIVDGTTRWDYISDPYETILADTDFSMFDDDLMIIGTKTKQYQMLGLDYVALEREYKGKIDAAKNRYKGSYRGSFYRGNDSPRFLPRTPGNWSF